MAAPKRESERSILVAEGLIDNTANHLREFGVRGDDRWRIARSTIGMGQFTLHDFRHFYASGLISEGCDVVTVQRAMGHSTPSITLNTYSHLWPTAEDKTRAAGAALLRQVTEPLADSLRTKGE